MRRMILSLFSVCLLFGCTFADNEVMSSIGRDFSNASNIIKNDWKSIKTQRQRGLNKEQKTLQELMDEIKVQKADEMAIVNKQIEEKEEQLKTVYIDTKLTASQKQAKASLLKHEIDTYNAQKENIERKYRKKIREFRN